jgi:hypothetical protein
MASNTMEPVAVRANAAAAESGAVEGGTASAGVRFAGPWRRRIRWRCARVWPTAWTSRR